MSKELYFTDGNNEVKYLDTTASFNLAITQDGSAFDLTNATAIDVKVANDTGYVFTKSIDMATIKQPLAGLITMPVDAEVMNALVPDDYTIEVWVTLSSLITPGSQEGLTDTGSTTTTATPTTTTTSSTTTNTTTYNAIFPSDDPQGFTITENVMSDSGDVIPVMSLDDFQQEFDQLKTDLTNQVSTLQGPKGDTGQGLEIKGKVNTTSQLPATASEGDGYLVNEELYVWTNGAWKDCGSLQGPQGIPGKTGTGVSSTTIQYQIANSATTTPTGTWSNSLIATTQVNPFLWTQVTLNYDDGTSKSFYLVSSKGNKGDTGATGATGPVGPQGPVGAGLVVKGTVSNASQLPTTGNQEGYCYFVGTDLYVWDAGAWKNCGNVSPDLSNYVTVTDLNNGLSTKVTDNKNGTIEVNGSSITPADDSKVLHSTVTDLKSTDMNTVITAGFYMLRSGTNGIPSGDGHTIYQVIPYYLSNGVQLAYGTNNSILGMRSWHSYNNFTSWVQFADDSKVVHDNHDGTISINGDSFTPAVLDSALNKNSQPINTDVDTLAKPGLYYVSGSAPNNPFKALMMLETRIQYDWSLFRGFQIAYEIGGASSRMAVRSIYPDGNITSVGHDALPWVLLSDDSKVAHLSGANNFDTVPTVNNNPLLLASSLPSDLARTGSDQEFTGKNTFDAAPIDKTTGNPYITKDGVPAVPSTLADTTKLSNFTAGLQSNGTAVATKSDVTTAISTATANMVDSTKATNFTAGLQVKGVDVATAADLKSVEDQAWRRLADNYITLSSGTLNSNYFLYKIDSDKKYLYVLGGIVVNGSSVVTVTIDFSWLVKNVKLDSNSYLQYYGNIPLNRYNSSVTGNKLIFTTNSSYGTSSFSISSNAPHVIYDELV
ncbi:hypothetical protein [Levilactobacillus sp. N40-8-2]|uniref:hypothetical protein n=1 Tax=Levilactobacillus muriae TaxID=3238987 RepID=UPI0038B30AC5